ncbi:hypothetical protein [Glaciecola sp. 1036]|uniref:hypothetical protein n=1 Tax=Alteromonadaceae TaxID=72275 RepID=UPI003D078AEA
MKQEELEELMQQSAADAVSTAQEELAITLDYSIESISLVDDVILQLREKYPEQILEDKAVFTICNIFGAYIGEVFLATAGGKWLYDVSDPASPSIFMQHGEHTFAFAGVCFEKLVRDLSVSITHYFEQALENVS